MQKKRKINRKKWLPVVLLVLLLAVTGCEEGGKTTPTPTGLPQETLTPTAAVKDTPTPAPTQAVENTPALTQTPSPVQAMTVSQEFDLFTEELFRAEIVFNTVNLHYTLAYPENYDITDYEPTLGEVSYEDMKLTYDAIRELKAEVEAYAYEELTDEQQFTYDIIMNYVETELSAEDLLLYNEYLGPVTGYQSQLPVILAEYGFRRERDVQDYLALLDEIDEVFAGILAFEQEKSKAGLFMPDATADAIIDQCEQFIASPEENYMLDVFNSAITEVPGLTKEQCDAYIAQNKERVTKDVVAAYQLLIDGLEELKGTGTNDKGLCYYEKGKEYYEYLTKTETGSDKSVETLATEVSEAVYNAIVRMQQVATSHPSVMSEFYTFEFCETEPEAIMEDLQKKIAATFPALPEVEYTIKKVHPSMQEHLSPAFYLTSAVDDAKDNVIYINEAYTAEGLYVTMAHEGFPGHLYQNVYAASKELPLIRSLFSFSGYTEGWATYVEFLAYDWGGLNPHLAEYVRQNEIAMLGIHAGVDIGIHYYGWDVAGVETFLNTYGIGSPETAQWFFDYLVAEPGAYLSYFVGYMEFENLKEAAKEAWGKEYTDMRFYETVLSLGPAPFALIEEEIRATVY